jgi:hypothetical protein
MSAATKNGPATNRIKDQAAEAAPPVEQGGFREIVVAPIRPKIVQFHIRGVTPLLVCRWSEKARREMLEKQTGAAKKKKSLKVPEDDYQASLYKSTEGWTGVPASGIKGCIVNACRAIDGLPMTLAKRMIFVRAQGYTKEGQGLVRIIGDHKMHEAMVRIATGVADIRFRGIYEKWEMNLEIEFLEDNISVQNLANLLNISGFVEGLCEHRPGAPKSNTGDNGRFFIVGTDEEK